MTNPMFLDRVGQSEISESRFVDFYLSAMSRPSFILFARIPLAGPSRTPFTSTLFRNVHTTALRRAAPTKRPLTKGPSSGTTTSTFPPRSSRIVAEAQSLWREMSSNVKGVRAEEILLFSRPFEAGKYTKHHLFFPILTGATVIYTSLYAVYMVQAYLYPPLDVRCVSLCFSCSGPLT